MKILFDQNISHRVIAKITHLYPEAKHVIDVGLYGFSDTKIWNFAKEHGYHIATFDSDFYELATIKGHPPKIIWLRIGNTTKDGIAQVFIQKLESIHNFLSSSELENFACLEIEN
jgi:predicted nuclease of predicted toxin-antitoxin system